LAKANILAWGQLVKYPYFGALSRAEAYVSSVDYIIKSLPAFRSKN
jgi:hypothetical protein